jgi:cytochrome c oxidase assembly protein subunit 15
MRAVRLSPRAYERLTLIAVVAVAFIIITGGAVRLTGSGLGCPDWPTCARGHVVAALSYHQMVEFVNRVVTAVVSIVVILAVLGSMVRAPRRRDLTVLSWGLVAGVVAQIVLGGLTVLAKLAPPFVMGHFLLSMALLADAVVLHHRAAHAPGAARRIVDRDLVRLGRLLVSMTALTVVLGTVVTSSGPHGGDPKARRFDLSLHRVTQVHGTAAMLLVALVGGTIVLLRVNRAPARVQRRALLVLEALAAQVAVGYAQYFTGVPALLVGVHIAGAAGLWVTALQYHLALTERVPLDDVLPSIDARPPVLAET